jgi:hypothetical protein
VVGNLLLWSASFQVSNLDGFGGRVSNRSILSWPLWIGPISYQCLIEAIT